MDEQQTSVHEPVGRTGWDFFHGAKLFFYVITGVLALFLILLIVMVTFLGYEVHYASPLHISKSPSPPTASAFGKVLNMSLDEWHQADSDGFAVLNVPNNGRGHLTASKDTIYDSVYRSRAIDETSTMILVPRGYYFMGRAELGKGELRWIPLLSQ